MPTPAIIRTAHPQHGCITYAQATNLESRSRVEALVRKGELIRVHPATYVVAGFPDTWLQRCSAAVLSVDGSVLSHRSAAKLWGLELVGSQRITITAPIGRGLNRENVTVRRSRQLPEHVSRISNIPVTDVERTLFDVCSGVSYATITKAIDEARYLKLTSWEDLLRATFTIRRSGMQRTHLVVDYLERNQPDDDDLESRLEVRTLDWIRNADLVAPQRQAPVIINGNRYIPDLSYPELRIAVEPRGPVHLLPSVAARDALHDADFQMAGWIVIPVPVEMSENDFLAILTSAIRFRQWAA